nr:exonuclease SbcCD subunit D [Gammaproteobacteria bacterium]
VTMYPEQEAQLHEREIVAALADADYVAAIQRDIDYPVRARLGVEHPEGLSHDEALERYLHAKEVSVERIERLMEAARELMDDPGAGS